MSDKTRNEWQNRPTYFRTLLRPFGDRLEFYFTLYILHKERKNKRITRLFFILFIFIFLFFLYNFYSSFILVLYNNNNTNTIQIHYIMSSFASLTSLFGIGIGITIALIFL